MFKQITLLALIVFTLSSQPVWGGMGLHFDSPFDQYKKVQGQDSSRFASLGAAEARIVAQDDDSPSPSSILKFMRDKFYPTFSAAQKYLHQEMNAPILSTTHELTPEHESRIRKDLVLNELKACVKLVSTVNECKEMQQKMAAISSMLENVKNLESELFCF